MPMMLVKITGSPLLISSPVNGAEFTRMRSTLRPVDLAMEMDRRFGITMVNAAICTTRMGWRFLHIVTSYRSKRILAWARFRVSQNDNYLGVIK